MMKRWGWILLLSWVLAQEFVPPTAELERGDDKIVATQTDPGGTFVIDYGNVAYGQIENLEEGRLLLQGGEGYYLNPESRLLKDKKSLAPANLQVGDWVEVAYNENQKNPEGFSLVMRLTVLPQAPTPPEGQVTYVRFVMADPKPARVRIAFGNDTVAFGNLAIVEKGLGESVVLSDGSAEFNPADFSLKVEARDTPDSVEVQQGKSIAFGSKLEYDNETGKANVSGPIRLQRSGEEPLKGIAQSLVYDIETEELLLSGGLELEQDQRKTTANTAIVNEKEGFAYLFGNPVRSQGPEGIIEGQRVRYSLEKGDIVVMDGIKGEFND